MGRASPPDSTRGRGAFSCSRPTLRGIRAQASRQGRNPRGTADFRFLEQRTAEATTATASEEAAAEEKARSRRRREPLAGFSPWVHGPRTVWKVPAGSRAGETVKGVEMETAQAENGEEVEAQNADESNEGPSGL